MKKIFFALFALSLVLCGIGYFYSNAPIVKPADYAKFLRKEHFEKSQSELASRLDFWKTKLAANPENFVYQKKLAGLYAADFKLSGNIRQLQRSDSLLQRVNNQMPDQTDVYFSLAANAITRHAFREAEAYSRSAFASGEMRFISSLLLTDVYLERGNFSSAQVLLQGLSSQTHFDFLIRKVKLLDQQGDLSGAIEAMEQATVLAKATGSKSLINWSLSNLADMYGHDGAIAKSYETYLQALQQDPSDFHALKGIAWIAFSHEKNTTEAKRILHFLQSVHPIPDYSLLLSEIALYEKDEAAALVYQQRFLAEASNPAYGNMYKSYICRLESSMKGKGGEVMALAKNEVLERPHPLSYALLAWSNFKNGDTATAVDVLQNHVLRQTEEPIAIYYTGMIFKAAGKNAEAKKYLSMAADAGFELGPVVKREVDEHLAQL